MSVAEDKEFRVRARKTSRPLWDAIANAKGWSFAEAAHRMAEKFCEVEGIQVPKKRAAATNSKR